MYFYARMTHDRNGTNTYAFPTRPAAERFIDRHSQFAGYTLTEVLDEDGNVLAALPAMAAPVQPDWKPVGTKAYGNVADYKENA